VFVNNIRYDLKANGKPENPAVDPRAHHRNLRQVSQMIRSIACNQSFSIDDMDVGQSERGTDYFGVSDPSSLYEQIPANLSAIYSNWDDLNLGLL
jgi:hypothetical protein